MALPQKKSRPITVNDTNFRYAISTTKIDDEGNFRLNLTVQQATGKGCTLKINGLVTRNFWLDFPELGKYETKDYPILQPSDISRIIRMALEAGWEPEEKGRPFVLTLENTSL